jgi:hypothetical protein
MPQQRAIRHEADSTLRAVDGVGGAPDFTSECHEDIHIVSPAVPDRLGRGAFGPSINPLRAGTYSVVLVQNWLSAKSGAAAAARRRR